MTELGYIPPFIVKCPCGVDPARRQFELFMPSRKTREELAPKFMSNFFVESVLSVHATQLVSSSQNQRKKTLSPLIKLKGNLLIEQLNYAGNDKNLHLGGFKFLNKFKWNRSSSPKIQKKIFLIKIWQYLENTRCMWKFWSMKKCFRICLKFSKCWIGWSFLTAGRWKQCRHKLELGIFVQFLKILNQRVQTQDIRRFRERNWRSSFFNIELVSTVEEIARKFSSKRYPLDLAFNKFGVSSLYFFDNSVWSGIRNFCCVQVVIRVDLPHKNAERSAYTMFPSPKLWLWSTFVQTIPPYKLWKTRKT